VYALAAAGQNIDSVAIAHVAQTNKAIPMRPVRQQESTKMKRDTDEGKKQTIPVLFFQPFSSIVKNAETDGFARFKLTLHGGIDSLLKLFGQLAASTCSRVSENNASALHVMRTEDVTFCRWCE